MDRQLIDYLPDLIKQSPIFESITTAEQPEIELLWAKLDEALKSSFVDTAEEDGVLRYERILKLTPKASDTIEDRRFRILVRLNEKLPYTEKFLNERLALLCGEGGYTLNLDYNSYTVEVKVGLNVTEQFDAVDAFLHRISPANLVRDVKIKYNTYGDLESFTYGDLESFTYGDLREGDLA